MGEVSNERFFDVQSRWMVVGLGLGLSLASVGCRRFRRSSGHRPAPVVIEGQRAPQTDEERTLYALGMVLGERLGDFNLTPQELAVVQRGMTDKITHQTPLASLETFGPRIRELSQQRAQAQAERNHTAGAAFADRAAQEPGATRTQSGLVFRELQAGSGASPAATDQVTVHYRGTLIDGTEFDSSYSRNEPTSFRLNGVIPCWTEGLQRMRPGGRARLVCPSTIAYGDRAQRAIPAGSTLIFEVELIRVGEAGDAGAGAGAH